MRKILSILNRLSPVGLSLILGVLVTFSLAGTARAECQLSVISAYPCNVSGVAYNPKYGEYYYLKIVWAVSGTPSGPYSILFKMAGETYKWTGIKTGAGSGYSGIAAFLMPLDGPIPWSITLDPDKVSGNTDFTHNVISSTMTPTPPATPLEYFNPVTHTGTETLLVDWNAGGEVTSGTTVMGHPVTGSFQVVNSLTGPAGSSVVVTPADGDPVFVTSRTNYKPTATSHEWKDTTNFTVTVSGARTRIASLEAVTWAQLANVSAGFAAYTKPDALVESTNPTIVAFVKTVLPANYKTTMTPYAAAKALYMAVVKRTVYQTPAAQDCLTTFNLKKGDCGSFTNLTSACLRSIGIPSRSNTGFWVGTNQWHVKGEFYFPTVGWVPFDASEDRLLDTSGTYPYYFGSDYTLNNFCAVGRGDNHNFASYPITYTQVGWLFAAGTATHQPYGSTNSLK